MSAMYLAVIEVESGIRLDEEPMAGALMQDASTRMGVALWGDG
jgi:hypothetical protein